MCPRGTAHVVYIVTCLYVHTHIPMYSNLSIGVGCRQIIIATSGVDSWWGANGSLCYYWSKSFLICKAATIIAKCFGEAYSPHSKTEQKHCLNVYYEEFDRKVLFCQLWEQPNTCKCSSLKTLVCYTITHTL
jgi:hypothetical protein